MLSPSHSCGPSSVSSNLVDPEMSRRHATRQKAYRPRGRYADPLQPEWLDGPVPKGFWNDPENHRRYLRWLGRKLGFRTWTDWYQLSGLDFVRNHGRSLLHNHYGHLAVRAVIENFPEHDWKEWLFPQVPNGFWEDPVNRRRYMNWLGGQLGFTRPEHWYAITQADFLRRRGAGLVLNHYGGSPTDAVKEYWPEYDWKDWLFAERPRNFWASWENRRRYMEWLGEQLGYHRPEDWYGITQATVRRHAGGGLLWAYEGSPAAAVRDCFREHDWHEWLFSAVPTGFWNRRCNRLRYLKWLEGRLGIEGPEGWYDLTKKHFFENRGTSLVVGHYRGSVLAAARELYPDYDWHEWRFRGRPKGLWRRRAIRVRFMAWLGQQLGIHRRSDWYRVTPRDFQQHGGGHLLKTHYRGSVVRALRDYLPEYKWRPERFAEAQP